MNIRVPLQHLDERKIAMCVCLLKNRTKIANRLMCVNQQDQMELRRHGDAFVSWRQHITCGAKLELDRLAGVRELRTEVGCSKRIPRTPFATCSHKKQAARRKRAAGYFSEL